MNNNERVVIHLRDDQILSLAPQDVKSITRHSPGQVQRYERRPAYIQQPRPVDNNDAINAIGKMILIIGLTIIGGGCVGLFFLAGLKAISSPTVIQAPPPPEVNPNCILFCGS